MVCMSNRNVCVYGVPEIPELLDRQKKTTYTHTVLISSENMILFHATYYILEILKIIFSYLNRYDRQEGSKWLFML